jgi:hypothetical protein
MTGRALDRFSVLLDNPKAGSLFGASLLAAAVVMVIAIFMPFVSERCINCLFDDTIPARSVFQGLDGWIVLLVVVALVPCSFAFLANRHRLGTAVACLALAASALTLCILERLDAAGRVLGQDAALPPVELGHPEVRLHGIPPAVYTDFGFYVLLVSSIVAFIAALGVPATVRRNRTPDRTAAKPSRTYKRHPGDIDEYRRAERSAPRPAQGPKAHVSPADRITAVEFARSIKCRLPHPRAPADAENVMAYREILGVVAVLTALCLAACAADVHTTPTVTTSLAGTASTGASLSPPATSTPIVSSGPWPESLSWSGVAHGALTEAYGTCRLYPFASPPLDQVALNNLDHSVEITIPRHAPGIVPLPKQGFGGDVSLRLADNSAAVNYFPTSGTVTYGLDGNAGSLDVWLAAQVSARSLGPPSLHLSGGWTCV